MSLFATAPRETHLVEFNAGKCIVEGSWIKPDLRKGKVYMDQGDDQLLHFYWCERKPQATPEDDLIIFHEEAEFTRVSQCSTGRVYLLRFKTSNERHFYWMQSQKEEKDEELVQRVNELIHDPEANMNTAELDESASHAELMRLLNGVESQDPSITPENLLQFLNNISGASDSQDEDEDNDEEEAERQNEQQLSQSRQSTSVNTNTTDEVEMTEATTSNTSTEPVSTTPVAIDNTNVVSQSSATTSVAPTSDNAVTNNGSSNAGYQATPEQLQQMREILAGFQNNQDMAPISLNDILTTQTLTPLLNDPELCSSLFPFLPQESERSAEEVKQIVRSSQFSQALQSLSAALNTGQLGPLLIELGLPSSAGNSVESFLRAISEQAKNKKQQNDAMDED